MRNITDSKSTGINDHKTRRIVELGAQVIYFNFLNRKSG